MSHARSSGECAKILKALGDESRLKIVRLLLEGEKCVSEIVDSLGMVQPLVSHHLSTLRGAGLVETRREGTRVINFVSPEICKLPKLKEMGIDLGCCSIKFDDLAASLK